MGRLARYLQDIIYSLERPNSHRRMKKVNKKESFGYEPCCYNIDPNLKDSIILKIRTSYITDTLKLDTEWECTYHLRTNIPLKYVSIHSICKLTDEDLCESKFIENLAMQRILYKQA